MNAEEIREYCLKMHAVEESFPFDNETLVFKIGGKIFLLLSLDSNPLAFNVKAKPEDAISQREQYTCVAPGYHMNKKHWNTITCNGTASSKLIYSWIDDSYNLVLNSLPKKLKEELSRT